MFKFLFLILVITIISFTAVWFIENDGSIMVEWMGYQIQTSITFTLLAISSLFLTLFVILQILISIKKAPENFQKSMKDKKKEKGLTALTEGFAAIAAGDTKQAKKLTKQAVGCLGNVPVTKLLSAQAAQLDGNVAEAKVHFTAMLENKETEIIAIKGLLLEAEKEGDFEKAISLAEKALISQPNSDWANKVLLRLYKLTKRWQAAKKATDRLIKLKLIDKSEAKRDIAIISLAQSSEQSKKGNKQQALEYAQTAYKELPDFAPAAVLYSSLLLEVNKKNKRKAINALEKCWKQKPHPMIASHYMEIFKNENAQKRLKHAERLLKFRPNNFNSHILVAKASISAENPSNARNHLKMALNTKETHEICNMMAEVERMEEADDEAINKWIERSQLAEPSTSWACKKCNAVQDEWKINCNNCGAFDSLQWDDKKSSINIINPLEKLNIEDKTNNQQNPVHQQAPDK
jgi:HemY protein